MTPEGTPFRLRKSWNLALEEIRSLLRGEPSLRLTLEKNRKGRCGGWFEANIAIHFFPRISPFYRKLTWKIRVFYKSFLKGL